MSANTAADALSFFLKSNPEPASAGGQLLDRLGKFLVSVGDDGLALQDAMKVAGLSRPELFDVLASGTGAGLIETFEKDGQQRIRLTPTGRSLY
jgi:hypothetical protein